jgi:hypothetical protein
MSNFCATKKTCDMKLSKNCAIKYLILLFSSNNFAAKHYKYNIIMKITLSKRLKLITISMLLCFCANPSFSDPVYMFPYNKGEVTRAPLISPNVDIENNEMILSSDGRSFLNAEVIIKDDKGNEVITQTIPSITSSSEYSIDISSLKQGVTYEIDFIDENITFEGTFDIK